jgi:hypothetical protein
VIDLCFQGSSGLGFAIGEGPSHRFGEQGICIKSITPDGVAEQVRFVFGHIRIIEVLKR